MARNFYCLWSLSWCATPWARATKNVKKPQSQKCESYRKAWFKVLKIKTETFLASVPYLILRFAIVQNKFQQTKKTKIDHINDNHIKLRFIYILGGSSLLCAAPLPCPQLSLTRFIIRKIVHKSILLYSAFQVVPSYNSWFAALHTQLKP